MREYTLRPPEVEPALVLGCAAEPRAETDAAGPGLSKGHIVTKPDAISEPKSSLRYWKGAGLLQIQNPYGGCQAPQPDPEKAKRGEIIGHSRKSQRRARLFLSKIPNEEIMNSFLVTLTYPGKQAQDKVPDASEFEIYKEHLRKFNQATKRKWNGAGLWFLVFQKRGAPHYHLIVFGISHDSMTPFQEWVSVEWNRIVEGGPDHLKAGTRVEIPINCDAARSYVTSYFTKGADAPAETKVGRFWGKFGSKEIPIAEEKEETLSDGQAKIATRTARRAIEHRMWESSWRRFKKFCGDAIPSFRYLSMTEFRTFCENARNGRVTKLVKANGNECWMAPLMLHAVAFGKGKEKIRFPQRYRHRSNSTVNLFCDANAFVEALKRVPGWAEE